MSAKPPIIELLENPEATLTRSDLAKLGYERRAIDAIFRACGRVEAWEGYGRPMIRVGDFLREREKRTYAADVVRPT